MKNKFYVYKYLDENDVPYYVGKGKNNRAFEDHGVIPVPTDIKKIIIIEDNLTEEDAFSKEKEFIILYGRKDLGNGSLLNKTAGGQGLSNPSIETKQKLSENAKNGITGMLGKSHSEETKKKMSKSAKDRGFTCEQREKISESLRGRKEDPEVGRKRGKAISEAKKGKPNGRIGHKHSEETKEKISQQKGWKHTESTKKIMSDKAKSRPPMSEETKKKISEKIKKHWEKRKKEK